MPGKELKKFKELNDVTVPFEPYCHPAGKGPKTGYASHIIPRSVLSTIYPPSLHLTKKKISFESGPQNETGPQKTLFVFDQDYQLHGYTLPGLE